MIPAPATSVPASAPPGPAMPVVDQTRAPASVRTGSPAVKQAYATAASFEAMLLQQLSATMVKSTGLEEEGGGEDASAEGSLGASGAGGAGLLAALAPQALAEGVARGGGLGLATQLTAVLAPSTAVGHTGGVSA